MGQDKPIDRPVYVTKYALSEGILKLEHGFVDEESGLYSETRSGRGLYLFDKDWTYVEKVADQRARDMARKKLKSLEKQREKLLDISARGAQVVTRTKP